MHSEVWDYLYLYFIALEESFLKISFLSENALSATETGDGDDSTDSPSIKSSKLYSIYREIEKHIQDCQENINPLVNERELKYLTSALIFHCDEIVLTKKLTATMKAQKAYEWPILQKNIVHCRDGGERFFNYLDKMLQHGRDYKMAIEVYFFCLKQGFVGCYFNHPEKIQSYLNRCSDVVKRNATLLNFTYGSTTLVEYKNLRDSLRKKQNSGVKDGALT